MLLCAMGAWRWGTPPDMGYPLPQTWGKHTSPDGVPPWTWGTTPPHPYPQRWSTPPRPEMEYPPYPDLRWGTPYLRPEMGYPPPPASVNRLKILPSPILRMRAVKTCAIIEITKQGRSVTILILIRVALLIIKFVVYEIQYHLK